MAVWLCGFVVFWLCGSVAVWLCGLLLSVSVAVCQFCSVAIKDTGCVALWLCISMAVWATDSLSPEQWRVEETALHTAHCTIPPPLDLFMNLEKLQQFCV